MNPEARDVLETLRSRGLQLTPVGHRLRAIGPKDALDSEIREKLAKHRGDIIDLIMAENLPSAIPLPLTNIQQRMHLRGEHSAGDDHVRSVFKIRGELDGELLASAAQALIQQHPALRMCFKNDDQQIIQVLGPERRFEIEMFPIPSDTTAEDAAKAFIDRPFQLDENPLLRIGIGTFPEADEHLLVVVVHHALADGQGSGILLAELARNYETFKSGRMPEIGSNQLATLQQLRLHHDRCSTQDDQHVQEWLDSLGADCQGSMPPCDEGEGASDQPSFNLLTNSFSEADKTAIESFQASHNTSLLSMAIAATSILIHRSTDDEYALIGIGISDRRNSNLERTIANLAIDIPLRTDIDGQSTVQQILENCQRKFLSSMERPVIPLEQIIAKGALKPLGRRRLRLPIALACYERRQDTFSFEGIELERVLNNHPNPFVALGIRLNNTSNALSVLLEWDESIFTTDRAQRLSDAFMNLILEMTRNPESAISALPFDETLREGIRLDSIQHGTSERDTEVRPGSLIESHLASIWSEMLGVFPVQTTDRFFALGGNSLQVIRLIDRIESTLGTTLSIADFMGDPTLHELSKRLHRSSETLEIPPALWLTKEKDHPRVFCLAGVGGLAAFSYRGVSNALEGTASLVGIQLPGVGGGGEATEDVLGMAEWVKEAVLSKAIPGEVIRLVGYSAGGVLALEAARLLAAEGHDIAPVVLLDTLAPIPVHKRGLLRSAKAFIRQARLARRIKKTLDQNEMLDLNTETGGRLEQKLGQALDRTRLALSRHQIVDYLDPVVLICSAGDAGRARAKAWRRVAKAEIDSHTLPYDHIELLNDGSDAVAELIKKQLG